MAVLGLDARLTGIDTNVLLRYLVRDDEPQYALAARFVEALTPAAPGFVTQVTLAEIAWVLSRRYRFEKHECLAVIRSLVETEVLEFEDGETVVRALTLAEEGADFADALIHASSEVFGVDETVTFDRHAAEALGWRLLSPA
ncbi:type II toxin-antitoxin system VapC family toxin [Microbacterium sp. 2FI]|uniref:PIN domain-containing protein n=1 Tax=Microbacterium sp. 2FI TaxID=2502193 RepID=UPI0010F5C607|nr:type II toxin-antitoxin system VapC family toxin [Microbacterium sp. 2FI]